MARAVNVLAFVVLIAAAGTMPVGSRASTSAADNKQAAETDAASLLSLVALPPGTVQSTAEPAGDGGDLADASQRVATPNLVDQHAWWIVPSSRSATIAFVLAHSPTGSKRTGGGEGGTGRVVHDGENGVQHVDEEWEVFGFPPIASTLGLRSVIVTAVQLPDGSSGVRADAQVVWLTPRPVSEVIPSGPHLMRVSVLSEIRANRSGQRPFDVASVPRIAAVVKLLNTLPAAQPGVRACPVDFGNRVRLVFRARRGAPALSTVTIDPGGCGGVGVVIGHTAEPELEGGSLLVKEIARAIAVPIHTRPKRRRG
jgi:hypothetical protein